MLPDKVKKAINYPVPAHSLKAGYGLGGMALALLGLLFGSGVFLAYFGYVPSTEEAYDSVIKISNSPVLANFRSIHSISAEIFLILIALHVTRIALTKSYYGDRRLTWNIGILILVLSTIFFFTGTLLKWDQEGYEAFGHVLWANGSLPMGDMINSLFFESRPTLKMFVVHVAVLPVLAFALIGVHLLLIKVLKISGLSPAEPAAPETESFIGHIKMVAMYSAVIVGVIVVASLFFQPDITGKPYEGVEWTKPPWPFLFIYTLENWFGLWALLLVPPVLFTWLMIIPSFSKKTSGWDMGQIIYFSGLIIIVVLILTGAWTALAEHMM